MKKFVGFSIASLMVLTARIASADDFSMTITDGSTITALRGALCGGGVNVFNIPLPSSCSGAIDPGTGTITIQSCTFAPNTEDPNAIVTLSATSGSGSYDGTNLTLTPDINVHITDNPPTFVSCDSAGPTSVPLSGVVTDGSGTISFGPDSIPGPTYAVTDTCPENIAVFLACTADRITDETVNLTIP
jgi:hypothetical protein